MESNLVAHPGHMQSVRSNAGKLVQFAVMVFLIHFSLSAHCATSIHIIGHSADGTQHPDKILIANIFKRRMRVDKKGQALVPVNLPVDHPLRSVFSVMLFGQQPETMERYWNEQYFKGISPPFVLSSMEAVKRFVASTPGAIGYVLNCQDDERTDVLMKLPLNAEQSRKLSVLCEDVPGHL